MTLCKLSSFLGSVISYPFSLKHLASKSWASSIETTSSTTSSAIVVTVVSLDKSFVETTPSDSSDDEQAEKRRNRSTEKTIKYFLIFLFVFPY